MLLLLLSGGLGGLLDAGQLGGLLEDVCVAQFARIVVAHLHIYYKNLHCWCMQARVDYSVWIGLDSG